MRPACSSDDLRTGTLHRHTGLTAAPRDQFVGADVPRASRLAHDRMLREDATTGIVSGPGERDQAEPVMFVAPSSPTTFVTDLYSWGTDLFEIQAVSSLEAQLE